MAWVIYDISPTVFNAVFSDLAALAIVAVFTHVITTSYPHLVWDSIKKGHPLPIEGIMEPPTLLDSMKRLRKERSFAAMPSMWITLALPLAVAAAAGAHAVADFYLLFENVVVAEQESFFLSTEPGGVATHDLLAADSPDECWSLHYPAIGSSRLVQQANSIAQGTSRFSVYEPEHMDTFHDSLIIDDIVRVRALNADVYEAGPFPISRDLDVQCEDPPPQELELPKGLRESNPDMKYFPDGTNSLQNLFWSSSSPSDFDYATDFIHIPTCNFEEPVKPARSVEQQAEAQDWSVSNFTLFSTGSGDGFIFGIRDLDNVLSRWASFSYSETELSCARDGGAAWREGRGVRDNMTFVIGATGNADNALEPLTVHPAGGMEFEVDYSVLAGPIKSPFDESNTVELYNILSWSRQCPVYNQEQNSASVETFPSASFPNVSGCVIDMTLDCSGLFPHDNRKFSPGNTDIPWCWPRKLSSMLVHGEEVDRGMLAAYGGIATRNGAIGGLTEIFKISQAMNSLAAAYIVTRKVVPAPKAEYDVRAIVKVEFVMFMLLPLFLTLPFLYFVYSKKDNNTTPPPVPGTTWDMMVLGHHASKNVPALKDSKPVTVATTSAKEPFPPTPEDAMYGLLQNQKNPAEPIVGVGTSFVDLPNGQNNGSPKKSSLAGVWTKMENGASTARKFLKSKKPAQAQESSV